MVQKGAGEGSSISDEEFVAAGATIVPDADDTWATAEMVLKVKEPIQEEYHRLRDDLVLFTYLHLAADEPLTRELMGNNVTGPRLRDRAAAVGSAAAAVPDVRGRGMPGAAGGRVLADEGAGWPRRPDGRRRRRREREGRHHRRRRRGAERREHRAGMGAKVTLLDTDLDKLRMSFWRYDNRIRGSPRRSWRSSSRSGEADLVIGAVLIPGAKAPKLVSNDLVAQMKPGSVLVDIAVDQGGCFADTRPTTHADPTYEVHDSIFYCVANMPGAVPNTSTYALTNATLPYTVALADKGWQQACRDDRSLALGLNTHAGSLANDPVGTALGIDTTAIDPLLS